jgi:DNA (cytosine-5)-methyltransferase 1
MTAKRSTTIRALEFYSGIGAFSQAAKPYGIKVVAAYDQSQWANQVYELNNRHKPSSRNLDSISIQDIPEADLWWLSPPCTPYSRRGEQKDMSDPRAKSFLHLIEFMVLKKPATILIENVEGFLHSKMYEHLCQTLQSNGYLVDSIKLCPTMFAVPMLRPRIFIVARLATATERSLVTSLPPIAVPPQLSSAKTLSDFIDCGLNDVTAAHLLLSEADAEKYEPVLNVVSLNEASDAGQYVICFTSGYYRCRKASGSLLRLESGRLRFFSPNEILSLLGFSVDFSLADLALPICYRLVGNSVDVRAIDYLLANALQ